MSTRLRLTDGTFAAKQIFILSYDVSVASFDTYIAFRDDTVVKETSSVERILGIEKNEFSTKERTKGVNLLACATCASWDTADVLGTLERDEDLTVI